jgi:predicted nuclease with TOPRIM domain
MPTPPKPFTVLTNEKKSHRTKSELNQRKQGEEALSTGVALRERSEVRNNQIAHKEFKRLNDLLKNIGKNDAIYETIINRYCIMVSECVDMETKREKIYEQAQRLEQKLEELGQDAEFNELRAITNDIACIYGTMINIDKQIQSKRKMLLDIEKENIMTIAAALRSIPKTPEKKSNSLKEILNG